MGVREVFRKGASRRPSREDVSAAVLRKRAVTRVTVEDAARAWFAGAFEHCLELCDAVRRRDSATRVNVGLLKARALLRLDRPNDALAVLDDVSVIPCGTDESLTTRMLTGAAYVRRGDVFRALDMLLTAQSEAAHAHRTIRAELALYIALAHYGRHNLDAAGRALDLVGNEVDIVHARAFECRGWIANARANSDLATTMFLRALGVLDRCQHHDRVLEANCVRALAHLAVERLDRGTWSVVEARRSRFDWSASGLAHKRFWIAYCASAYQLDVEGDPLEAAREARHAESIAPNDAYRTLARCKRTSIARHAGEPVAQRDHVESAVELFGTLQSLDLAGDETIVPLVLAEELASMGNVGRCRALLSLHHRLTPTSPMLAVTHSPAAHAYQLFIHAKVAEAAGDRIEATRGYGEALDIYRRFGFRRRGATAALRLANLRGGNPKLYAYVDAATQHLPERAWIRRELAAGRRQTVRLTAVQREVLALICRGKSNPEIALSRKRSLHTIRNLVSRLFEIFEVSSREELAVECVRRGLYTPA